jgi:glycosyltransferase involved in cell wall biosynthesis
MTNSSSVFSRDSMFLVWGPPDYGPRSRALSRELGLSSIHYIYSTRRRGLAGSLIKYPHQALTTLELLFRKRPRLVFVQSPPSLAVIFVWLYCRASGARYIVDAHSDAFQRAIWLRPLILYRFLARKALATIVTNQRFGDVLEGWGARALILRDVPTKYPSKGRYGVAGKFNVAVVNTFASDEPLDAVMEAAANLPEVHFYVTGDIDRAPQSLDVSARSNVHFTGFLPDETYYTLLHSVDAVMCLTTRDSTMQRGACESLAIGKPIITSNWPILREYFRSGAVHVANTPDGIGEGVLRLKNQYDSYLRQIRELQISQRREWTETRELLATLVHQQAKRFSARTL